ncbi:ORF-46 peptide [Chrysodeixis chalcites nucleopolyhedrovirus]|uniref:ORF-46 peptide n=1 Tax=Chrysodeixis chalcites nucleopolyhedrovirus TaxID=320432 RepID=Q4KT34_9ABAC|nr:ORF-46 peptide [Chrysodeixis chalcites nucleopolyhedrovirus]AGC36261.1 hypothetical protein TF1A_0046 [Chrysodeixis chalcites SNPV TF1-A]AAY83977.1 ORF-46 peptide [Chrysodeixis chalcites nucleopolyhedrovirus]AGE61308.1 hypothetical protein [Chrysodeixis chalcites nucleopolyhedrovirus]AGE61457.1 hypothetical protein [Chrysodeixis chalcites nucleopolyhedrovirus]AGE61606.1 hypothetical protein [Chrysodeixis chalcites nucleopolyhedrovirus]
MNKVNFQLKKVINNIVDTKMNKDQSSSGYSSSRSLSSAATSNQQNAADFYTKHKSDVAYVGRNTTYNVVGQRNYGKYFDEKTYKF